MSQQSTTTSEVLSATRTAHAAAGFCFPGGAVARRRRAPKNAVRRDELAPTPERLAQGSVVRLAETVKDSAGHIARPYRAIDILAAMERRGTITPEMHAAGDEFRDRFRIAALDQLRAGNFQRIPIRGKADEPGYRVEASREWIWRRICSVGGLASPGGSVLWNVVGLELSLKEWALQIGWAGHPMSQEAASGALISALGMLAAPRG